MARSADRYALTASPRRDRFIEDARSTRSGPTVLCDERGPRTVSIPEREEPRGHNDELAMLADQRAGGMTRERVRRVDGGYLKLWRE